MAESALILMADDDEDFVFLARLALQRAGLRTSLVAVHNGVELIDYLQGSHDLPGGPGNKMPSLIILDSHLRLLTGYQVLKWIRMQPKFADLPVVVLTCSDIESQDMRARQFGATEYGDKPFTMEELINLMQGLHGRHIQGHATPGRAAA